MSNGAISEKSFQSVYLLSDVLLKYSQKTKKSLRECSEIFEKHHVSGYILKCYDYLHLQGTEYIVEDIFNRIEAGEDFA